MPVTIATREIAAALRLPEFTSAEGNEVSIEVNRLLGIATIIVETYAPGAPDNIQNEAAVRLIGLYYDRPLYTRRAQNALTASGAAELLNPYKKRRVIGSENTPDSQFHAAAGQLLIRVALLASNAAPPAAAAFGELQANGSQGPVGTGFLAFWYAAGRPVFTLAVVGGQALPIPQPVTAWDTGQLEIENTAGRWYRAKASRTYNGEAVSIILPS